MLNFKLYLICLCLSTVACSDYKECKASVSENSMGLIVYFNDKSKDGKVIKNCAVMEACKEAEYSFHWVVGDTDIQHCHWQPGYDNPQCPASLNNLGNVIGIPKCIVTMRFNNNLKGETRSCTVSVKDFIIASKPLREDAKSEIVGSLTWNIDSHEKSTKLAGEKVHARCYIEKCKARFYYTIDWFLKSSNNENGRKIFDSCSNMQTDNDGSLVCSAVGTLPMEEEGELFCRASTAAKYVVTADSDTLYTVRKPKIEVTHNNDGSYTCLVNKFDPYYLTWTSSGDKLTAKDYKDCSNTTHSCAQLHRKFTTDTSVSCVYGNENINIKQYAFEIKKSSTTTPSMQDSLATTEPSPTSTVVSADTITTTLANEINSGNSQGRRNRNQQTTSRKSPSKQNNSKPKIPSTTTPSTIIGLATTTITSTNALSSTTSEYLTETGLDATTDNWNTENSYSVSVILTIVGVVITIVGNTLAFGYYCARRRKCCQKESKEESQNSDRNESNKGCGEEPTYSVPHKWLSRPSKKEPTVSYTALDLMPSASWTGKEDTAYVEIIGVEKPFYDEVVQAPVYSNLMESKMARQASEPEYSNALFEPEVQYAEVLPKSCRKKK